jgi:hypothetical protein
MPMFATLFVADLEATTSWYVDGLDFISLFAIPGRSGPVLVHLRRWQFQDLLVRPATARVSAARGCSLSFAAVYRELDELAARARAHGGGRVDGPANTAWNTRDLTTIDPDGGCGCAVLVHLCRWRLRARLLILPVVRVERLGARRCWRRPSRSLARLVRTR